MANEMDVSFLGLNGFIDEEVAKALFQGEGDITAQPTPDKNTMSAEDQALYKNAKRLIREGWNQEMRRQGIKVRPSDYSQDHPSMLLKNKNAEVLAGLTTEMAPEIRDIFDTLATNGVDAAVLGEIIKNAPNDVALRYMQAILSGMENAADALAKGKGGSVDELSEADQMVALDRWADETIAKEMAILTNGQQAKNIFLLSREIPQESDYSGKEENHARSDAYRKLYHTRSKISMFMFSDYLEDKAAREEAIYQASPEELMEESAYVEGFMQLLSDTDRRIVELLLDGETQTEIAKELGISQSKVSKHRRKIQLTLLEYDPEIKPILHLFETSQKNI